MSGSGSVPYIDTQQASADIPSTVASPLIGDAEADFSNLPSAQHGHTYRQGLITGGRVHFGDRYITNNYNTQASNPPELDLFTVDHAICLVPRRSSRYFTGRVLQLEQANVGFMRSLTGLHGHKTIVLHGLGGSGKTQFCLRFCEEHKNSYRGIFWIDASTQQTSDNSYAEIASHFGKGRLAAAGKYWLSKFQRPWLLVVDNADDPALDLSLLLPPGNAGHVLITTRNPDLVSYSTVTPIRLANMDPDEAIELLLVSAYPNDQASRSKADYKPLASAIAKRLGYLAIAIHHAGSTIRRRICTLEKYLSSYLDQRGLLMRPGSYHSIDKEQADIITTWEIPFRTIEAQQSTAHRDAVAIFHVLAFLHYESIPESVLEEAMLTDNNVIKYDFNLPNLFRDVCSNRDAAQIRLREALSILYGYSVIEMDEVERVCSVHPVIHEWARARISAAGSVEQWLRCTAFVLSCSGQEHWDSYEMIATPLVLLPHIDSLRQTSDSCEVNFFSNIESASMMERIALIYERAGRWHDALGFILQALECRAKLQRRWHVDVLRSKRRASLCYWNLFEVGKAIGLQLQITATRWIYRPSLIAWTTPLKPSHTEYLLSLSDLTQTLWLAGVLNGSRVTGERAVSGLRLQLGPNHLLTLEATFNLARTYRHIGKLEEAHRMLVKVLHLRREILGREHIDTLMVLNELGMSFCSRNVNLALAEKLVRQVLRVRRRLLGTEHAYTLWSVNDLAKILTIRGRCQEAVSLLEEAIPAVTRTLGDGHVGMTMTKGNLARAYAQMQRPEQAESLLTDIIKHMEPDHPDWMRSMIGRTRLQIRLGRLNEAEQSCKLLIATLCTPKEPTFQRALTNLKARDWKVIAGSVAAWYIGQKSDSQADHRTVVGMMIELYTRKGDVQRAAELALEHPDADTHILDTPFELV